LQLFGTAGGAVNGFAALALYDTDDDNYIDQNDPIFNQLRVWVDSNNDGQVESGELFSLTDLGVAAINLRASSTNETIAGNSVNLVGSYALADGTRRTIADVWFANSLTYTKPDAQVVVPSDIAMLPQVSSSGMLTDLHAAMVSDPTLKDLVATFANNAAFEQPTQILSDVATIMLEWGGASGVDPAVRGSEFDARELTFLERYTGVAFYDSGYIADLVGQPADPRWQSAIDLREAWDTGLDAITARLLLQSGYPSLEFIYNSDIDAVLPTADFPTVFASLFQKLGDLSSSTENQWVLALRLADASRIDTHIDSNAWLASLQSASSDSITAFASALLAGMQATPGASSRFDLTGPTHQATIYAGSQIELIQIHGEDSVDPATLANTVVYNIGDGQLELDEADYSQAPANTLALAAGIAATQVTVTADSAGNVYLTDGTTGDRIKLDNEMLWAGSGVQSVSFADGTTWTRQQLLTLADTGTSGPDILYGGPDADVMDGKGARRPARRTTCKAIAAPTPSSTTRATARWRSTRTPASTPAPPPRCGSARASHRRNSSPPVTAPATCS
jgi:hypothetical protein